jgi:hypothetical protein
MDEGYTINAVLSINEKGAPILDSGQTYSCPVYCYTTGLITRVFGENAFSFRFLSVLFGILFIFVIFYIVRKLFNEKIALLSSFFITFSYWQIAWSRQARWYTLFSVFFWLALYFFYQTRYGKNKKRNVAFTVFFTTLAILTHGLGALLPFIFFAWFLVDKIFIQKAFDWKKPAFAAAAFIATLSAFQYVFNSDLYPALARKVSFHYELPYYLSFYLREYWFFAILSLFAVNITDSKNKRQMGYLSFIFLSYFLSLSFLTDIVHYRYLFQVTPVFFILASVAIISIEEYILPQSQSNGGVRRTGFVTQSETFGGILKLSRRNGVVPRSETFNNVFGHCFFHKIPCFQVNVIIFYLIIATIFFTIGSGVLVPHSTYYLESDNPETLGPRPHYAYTPQPEWNAAYEFIKNNKQKTDIVISSQPQFNKIFLGEPGYWLEYDYLGMTDEPNTVKNANPSTKLRAREYYVGAQIISNLSELQSLIKNNHGYIIFDYMAIDGKIPQEITDYIQKNTKQVFHQKTTLFSQVWVYKF